MKLDPGQERVATHFEGPMLAVAVAGCLAGSTQVELNRGGKSFRTTIAHLVKMNAGGFASGKQWDPEIPTMVRHRAADGFIRLARLETAWASGVKETWTVRTAAGKTARATLDHRFLTSEGWKRLGELSPGVEVYVDGGEPKRGPRAKKRPYLTVTSGMEAHPYAAKRGVRSGRAHVGVPVHRLVTEAHLNNLSYDAFLDALRMATTNPTIRALVARFVFLDPSKVHVHHVDEDSLNNALENLVVLPRREHYRQHGVDGGWQHVTARAVLDRVVEISRFGLEETFDLAMAEEPHNFLACGFVVHNSGKTTSIAARLVNMVAAGITPSRILATTFSVKGAEEIRRKLPLAPAKRPDIGTLHSVAWRIVRAESKTSWKLDDKNRYETIVKQVLGYQGMRWEQADHDAVLSFIGLCKAEIALVGSSESVEIAEAFHAQHGGESTNVEKLFEAYERAEKARLAENLLTFDDQLVEAALLLRQPAVAQRWRGVWDYIIQDEAQDQNRAQAAIVDTLAEGHRNYLLVGDPAQCIYAWRGARFDRLLAFAEAPWSAEVVRLEHSYRCGPAVAKVANRVLARLPAEQTQYGRTVVSQGAPDTVDAEAYDDGPSTEADETVERIKALVEAKVEKRDIAVLYRIGEQSTALEERLLAAKVPFRVVGGVSFFERKEVANLLAYVRLVEGRGTARDIERSLKAPFRYLSVGVIDGIVKGVLARPTATWDQLAEWLPRDFSGTKPHAVGAVRTWAYLLDSLIRMDERQAAPGAIVSWLLQETNYLAWLKKDEGEDSPENNRERNALEVQRIAERFETLGAFLDFVDAMIRGAAAVRKVSSTADVVTLSTIHRAKGLEWPYVFLTGISDGLFPHSRAHADEELRLLYVACTRAKKALRITGSMQYAADGDRYPPQFMRLATAGTR